MCGIAGYVRRDGGAADVGVLKAMCDVIEHRGPDGAGYLVEGPFALGMRRLAIIDVAGSDQPIHNEDGRLSIVFNGECYNFEDNRKRLRERGHTLKTTGDTETIVHLYEDHGVQCVDHLRGMFAFALLDRTRQRILLARDRLGKKPLHYFVNERFLLFGSEIKSILKGMALLGIPRPEPDPRALVNYMGYGYIPDPDTAFCGIRKLPPGHTLTLDKSGIDVQRYWRVDFSPSFRGSEDEALEELDYRLSEAVRLRMISEVPLGAYLSGGIDSSTVVGLMARHAAGRVKTFSIGFEDEEFNELPYARQVAEHLGTEHHEFVVRPDARAVIDSLVRSFDEPFGDSSAIPTYYVSKIAREHVTVVLSGDGGDEFFAGYPRYYRTETSFLTRLPQALRSVLFGGAAHLLPVGFFGRGTLFALSLDDDKRYVHAVSSGELEWHHNLFTREFSNRVGSTDPSPVFLDVMRRVRGLDAMSRRMTADAEVYLPSDIMTKVDRMSMAVSLEARAPLLDHEFVEFAASLPLAMKTRNGESKYLLRRLARRLVPATVIDRRKRGFGVPIRTWFNRDWLGDVDDLILGAHVESRGLFQRQTLDRLVREHRAERRDHSQILWNLMMLEWWFRRYIDEQLFAGTE